MVDMRKKTQRFDKPPQERRRSQNGGNGGFAFWVTGCRFSCTISNPSTMAALIAMHDIDIWIAWALGQAILRGQGPRQPEGAPRAQGAGSTRVASRRKASNSGFPRGSRPIETKQNLISREPQACHKACRETFPKHLIYLVGRELEPSIHACENTPGFVSIVANMPPSGSNASLPARCLRVP
jgi:hypothetical protein